MDLKLNLAHMSLRTAFRIQRSIIARGITCYIVLIIIALLAAMHAGGFATFKFHFSY